jgi:hypothetical protein
MLTVTAIQFSCQAFAFKAQHWDRIARAVPGPGQLSDFIGPLRLACPQSDFGAGAWSLAATWRSCNFRSDSRSSKSRLARFRITRTMMATHRIEPAIREMNPAHWTKMVALSNMESAIIFP